MQPPGKTPLRDRASRGRSGALATALPEGRERNREITNTDRRAERARHETRRSLRHERTQSETAGTERARQGDVEPDGTHPRLARGSLDVPDGNTRQVGYARRPVGT